MYPYNRCQHECDVSAVLDFTDISPTRGPPTVFSPHANQTHNERKDERERETISVSQHPAAPLPENPLVPIVTSQTHTDAQTQAHTCPPANSADPQVKASALALAAVAASAFLGAGGGGHGGHDSGSDATDDDAGGSGDGKVEGVGEIGNASPRHVLSAAGYWHDAGRRRVRRDRD